MNKVRTGILIVGGGAAGMSAAVAASANKDLNITIIDDNPGLGGQIWRAELGKAKSPDARKLISATETGKINIVNNAQVFDSSVESSLFAETPNGTIEFKYEKLIIATGARERFLPFPGWTLPNVLGAGGLQALVKGGLQVENRRIVVAGTGPLLLAVADYLKSKGGHVITIAEQAPRAKINKFALKLWRSPSKIVQAVGLRSRLTGVPYLTDCWVRTVAGSGKLDAVQLTRKGRSWSVECDYLACSFDLVPNTEFASILGCKIKNSFVVVDEFQRTTCENVLCAGEPTGIGGVDASLIEGTIAGLAAIGEVGEARKYFDKRERTQKFSDALKQAFALRDELRLLSDKTTLVCRCEDVEYGSLQDFETWRTAKLQTRCGMGACQGRVCGAATEFLFGWGNDSVRPPIFPVRLENL